MRRARVLVIAALAVSVLSAAGAVATRRGSPESVDVGAVPLTVVTEPEPRPVPTAPAVGTQPARLEDLAPRQTIPPIALRIDSLGVDVPVVPVGVRPETGEMAVPPDPGVATWYEHGPTPGDVGSAVVAAHVDYGGRPGAFFRLSALEPGASVIVTQADGSERRFVVSARREFDKPSLPVGELFARDGPPTLVLVTCGGAFDRAARSYVANVVVYAVPA